MKGNILLSLFLWLLFSSAACMNHQSVQQKEMVASTAEINTKADDLLKNTLDDLLHHASALNDSIKIKNAALVQKMYEKNNNQLFWSSQGVFNKETDSLIKLIDSSRYYGLFPNDYYATELKSVFTTLKNDTSANNKLDAAKWGYCDLLSTAAFVQLVRDLKAGRLLPDSVLTKDSSLQAYFFIQQKQNFATQSIGEFTASLEPSNKDYQQLKQALQRFLVKANLKSFTFIKARDSLLFPKLVYQRICEEDSLKISFKKNPDSLTIANAIKKYQQWKKIKVDGKVSKALITRLNQTDKEKFIRIAITLDKYKQLPQLPDEYIWVNLPGFYLEVRSGDSVILKSKIICGKPTTHTPQLTSAITDMVTYPQWTIPDGIIKKEVLPALQRDPGYIERKGFSLVDAHGNPVDPYSVKWSKYKNAIPYKVVQGSGDANALGVLKFNFPNDFAVYLHDTNQRYLFDKSNRSLSHGCVRVQRWKELAYYLLQRDSLADSSKFVHIDSLNSWLAAKKKKYIRVHQQLPLFIRYFSCEGKDGKLMMYEDIYDEDKQIRDRLFATK